MHAGRTWTVMVALIVALASGPARADKQGDAVKLYKEGVKLGNAGKLEEAVAKWRESARLYPALYVSWIKIGMAYEMQHRVPEAAAAYDLAVAAKKGEPDPLNSRGEFYLKQRILDWALADFLSAAKLMDKEKKKKPGPYQNAAKVLLQLERYDEADTIIAAGLKAVKADEELTFYHGFLAMKRDKDGEAENAFLAMQKANPDSTLALYGLGLLYKKRDYRDRAKEVFGQACKQKHKPSCSELSNLSTRSL